MSATNGIALVGLAVMIGLVAITLKTVERPRDRRLMHWLAGGAAALIVSDRIIIWTTFDGSASMIAGSVSMIDGAGMVVQMLTWLLYAGLGVAVVVGVVAALRNGATRFAWRQGRYQKYRQYRRI